MGGGPRRVGADIRAGEGELMSRARLVGVYALRSGPPFFIVPADAESPSGRRGDWGAWGLAHDKGAGCAGDTEGGDATAAYGP